MEIGECVGVIKLYDKEEAGRVLILTSGDKHIRVEYMTLKDRRINWIKILLFNTILPMATGYILSKLLFHYLTTGAYE